MRTPPVDRAGRAAPPEHHGASGEPAGSGGSSVSPWPPFDAGDLERVRSGDTGALGRFFDHYSPRIFSLVYRYTGSVEAAKDITQEIFFKVRRGMGRLDLARDPAPWLYTVAVRACLDHRRSSWWRISRRSVPLDDAGIGTELTSPDADPEQVLLAAEEDRRVHAAIARLQPELRMSVILHDLERLPHEEIATMLNVSHAAARKRHSRALRALMVLLREDG